MSWSVVVNDLDQVDAIPEVTLAKISEDNPAYEQDAITAFAAAKVLGLVSATLAGGRTPHPTGGPDTVILSVHGFDSHRVGHAPGRHRHDDEVRKIIGSGPDAG